MQAGYMTIPKDLQQSIRMRPMGEQLPEWLEKIIIGVGGVGSGGYFISRLLKRDMRNDNLDEKANGLIQNLERQLCEERAANKHLHDAIDRIAKERNEAVQNVGRLEGHVQALESQVQHLRDEVQSLKTENGTLIGHIDQMRIEMAQAVAEARKMTEVLAKMGGVIQ